MKRKDLAERSGLSYPYVSELEKGTKEPSARALRQLAEALELSSTELLALSERYAGEPGGSRAVASQSVALGPTAADTDAELLSYVTALAKRVAPEPVQPNQIVELVAKLVRAELDAFKREELPGLVASELQRTLAHALQQGIRS